jgi:cytochrome c-type biogenesis protein CcmH/NrfG
MFRPQDFAGLTTLNASPYRARASRPSARTKVASLHFLIRSSTPPLQGGEYAQPTIHSHLSRPRLQKSVQSVADQIGIILGMRVQRWLFLLIGFAVGFGALYSWTKERAPDVVKALPLEVDPNLPTQLPSANPAAAEPTAPPVDMARVKELTEKIKQNPKDFDSIVELGNMDFDQKAYADAINLYKLALQVRPDVLNVRTDMGTAMFYLNRFDDAIATFQEVLKTDPKNAQALFNLGVSMLHGKNDPKRALEYWEKLVETNPDHPQAAFVREQIKKLKEQQQKKP